MLSDELLRPIYVEAFNKAMHDKNSVSDAGLIGLRAVAEAAELANSMPDGSTIVVGKQPAAVVELTDAELEAGRHQVFSTNNPFCPCDSKTFRKAARWAIAAHIAKQSGGAT